MKKYVVYVLASHRNGALVCGVTGNLVHKVWQHRAGHVPGVTAGAGMLVWYEEHIDMRSTLRRQQQIERASRDWQLKLVEQANPGWNDLYDSLLASDRAVPAEAA